MFFGKRNHRSLSLPALRGFTLIELLVTISIFAILTAVVLFNQSRFDSSILLSNLAYDTALTIRQAQNYGINVREFEGNGFLPYGVHFETGEGKNKSFILFADINNTAGEDPFFDGNTGVCLSSDGCVNRYTIKRGNYISMLCFSEGDKCSTYGSGEAFNADAVDIVFRRPNPDAIITYTKRGRKNSTDYIRIVLSNIDNTSTREVVVRSNGLIEVLR